MGLKGVNFFILLKFTDKRKLPCCLLSFLLYTCQVRSLGAESHRAYQREPLKHTHYQEASLLPEEVLGDGMLGNMDGFVLPSQYT